MLRNLQLGRLKICPFEELISYVPERATVLDMGCGRALFLGLLAGLGRNIRGVGVDMSERAVRAAEITARLVRDKRPGSTLLIQQANHESLPEGSFEIVSIIDVMHHVPAREQRKFLAAAVARLAPGGLLLYKDMVSTPLWRVFANRFHDLLVSGEVIHEIPLITIRSWAADHGLQCLRSGLLNRYWYGHEIAVFRKGPGGKKSAGAGGS